MNCLGCGAAMTSWTCACGGAWVGVERLSELAEDVRGAMVTLPWASRSGEPRACPQCGDAMRTVSLAGVALDRCFAHGIWFDADELQQVLRHAESFPQADGAPAPAAPPAKKMSSALAPGQVACSGCGVALVTSDVLYTADGDVVCSGCFRSADLAATHSRADDSSSVSGSSGAGWAFLGALLEVVADVISDD